MAWLVVLAGACGSDVMAWLVVLAGVCGSGKTAVGHLLAEEEKAVFIEGDDFHTPGSIGKMGRGEPLTDQDRQPWLEALNEALYTSSAEGRVRAVLTCSALKRSYRDTICGRGKGSRDLSTRCVFVQLTASEETLTSRVAERAEHFMPASLVASQLAILEPLTPDEGPCLTCQTHGSIAGVVQHIQQYITSLNQ